MIKNELIKEFLFFLLKEDIYIAYIETLMMFGCNWHSCIKKEEFNLKNFLCAMDSRNWICDSFPWDNIQLRKRSNNKYKFWVDVHMRWLAILQLKGFIK